MSGAERRRREPFAVARLRRRGAFGLDDGRRPDPARVAAEIEAFLRAHLPELLVCAAAAAVADGRTLVLLLARGHAAVLRVERDPRAPCEEARALATRCRAGAVPLALVASLAEARAALRRFGIEPRPSSPPIPFEKRIRPCPAKPAP